MREFPVIEKEGFDFAVDLVKWIDETVKRNKWSNSTLDQRFGKRSASQICREGSTCYMNPCLDLTLVTAAAAQANGIRNSIVFEEHGPTRSFPFNRLHFAVELYNEESVYHINYRGGKVVEIRNGQYLGRRDLPQVQIFRKHSSEMDYGAPLHENFGYKTLRKALKMIFHGYDLTLHLNRLKEDNTEAMYEEFLKRNGTSFEIRLA